MSAFAAKYGGKCAGCGERIIPGEQVVYVDDELAHLDCEEWAIGRETVADVCPECWLVRPCACQDGQ